MAFDAVVKSGITRRNRRASAGSFDGTRDRGPCRTAWRAVCGGTSLAPGAFVTSPLPLDLSEVSALQAVVAGVRVLVVDDDARIRRAIASTLGRAGFHVLTADDGEPALALAEASPPDLAIVDFHMPTPGLEVVRRLKSMHGAAIWIGVLSGQVDDETRTACFEAGADDVLSKPIVPGDLKQRLYAASRTQQAYVESRLAQERLDRKLAYGAEAAAMLAHDLNNGLVVALCNIELLKEVLPVAGEDAEALDVTLGALRRMSGLVSNFVDIARFEDAAVKPACVDTNVSQTIHAVLGVHRITSSPAVRFEVDCSPERMGFFDPALIERVLHNLVGNATRYCTRGVIRVSARGWDRTDPTAVELEVFNSGAPITADARAKLFVKYAKGAGGKRGFGLYFARLACEAHGGVIECRDAVGGVSFAFRLPGRR